MSSRRQVNKWKIVHVHGRGASFVEMLIMSKKIATDSIIVYQIPNLTIHTGRKSNLEI